jgi:hypothetical protein
VPLERVEAQICELAGHLAAATCRFLVLLADFDARRGWASWEMSSCAQWLSWKCQMSSGTAGQAGDLRGDVSAETPAAPETPAADIRAVRTSSDLADGLVAVAESFLAGKVAGSCRSYVKAPMPVMARPTMSVCMVSVPSKVWMASISTMCRMTW